MVVDDRWRRLLPLLQKGDVVAQGEVYTIYFAYVFGALLVLARRQNSHAGAPLPDDDLKELVESLTSQAFASTFERIAEYDQAKSALPTALVWRGKALMRGIVGKAIREALRDQRSVHLDDPDLRPTWRWERQQETNGLTRSPEQELEHREQSRILRAKFEGVLERMQGSQASALIEVLASGKSISSVAEAMGKSSTATDSLLRRAVREFRRLWIELYGSEGEI